MQTQCKYLQVQPIKHDVYKYDDDLKKLQKEIYKKDSFIQFGEITQDEFDTLVN